MKESSPRIDSRKIAVTAMYVSIILLMNWVPYLGFIPPMPPLTTAKITFLLIPVILAAQNEGLFTGMIAGAVWGILSLVGAATAYTPFGLTPYLLNPMISILPRLCIGVTVFFTFKALRKKCNFHIASVISTIIGVVTNTALVLSMFLIFSIGQPIPLVSAETGSTFYKASGAYALSLITLNFLIEMGICLIVVPAATYAMHKARRIPLNGKKPEKKEEPKEEENGDAARD